MRLSRCDRPGAPDRLRQGFGESAVASREGGRCALRQSHCDHTDCLRPVRAPGGGVDDRHAAGGPWEPAFACALRRGKLPSARGTDRRWRVRRRRAVGARRDRRRRETDAQPCRLRRRTARRQVVGLLAQSRTPRRSDVSRRATSARRRRTRQRRPHHSTPAVRRRTARRVPVGCDARGPRGPPEGGHYDRHGLTRRARQQRPHRARRT